jgi:predicted nucleic acid-binding protein
VFASFTALFDACVLVPAQLRDFLLRLAMTGLFRAKWSADIHEEWMRTVLRLRPELRRQDLERVRVLMDAHALDSVVTEYKDLVPAITLPDPGDRHVLAAAIKGRADVIVTFNLKHFPEVMLAKWGIEAQHPDEFVINQFSLNPAAVCTAARLHRASLRSPPFSVRQYIDLIHRAGLPQTAAALDTADYRDRL